jgi:multiple sugar transport system permease protein
MKKPKIKPIDLLILIILSFSALIFILPFLYAIYTSLKELKDVNSIVGLDRLSFDNYIMFFTNPLYMVPRWLWNSSLMTAIIITGNIIINTMAGYALAKLNFPGKNVIFFIVVATLMIPYHMILIPVYVNMAQLGWLNTMLALTVPYLYQCIYVFLMRQFFMSVPNELLEAARIDGLTKAGAFFKIVMPLAKSGIITMIILSFTGTWNSFLIPSTMISRREMYVLIVGLNSVKNQFFERTNIIMAGVVLVTIPVIIMFMLFQKQYVEGVATSGLKG